MKNNLIKLALLSMFTFGMSFSATAAPSAAEAFGMIKTALSTAAKNGAEAVQKARVMMCRKGDVTTATFSLRSFGGILCNHPVIGRAALWLCTGVGDFEGSQCDKNAKIAAKTPMNKTQNDYYNTLKDTTDGF